MRSAVLLKREKKQRLWEQEYIRQDGGGGSVVCVDVHVGDNSSPETT